MSATGRKKKTTETGDEFYPTPRKVIGALLESSAGEGLPGGTWIEPCALTFEFVKAAGRRAIWVVCLQRQGWFGTKGRSPWLAEHIPDIRQLPERPSFRPDGSTDNCEYCWFIWPPGAIEEPRYEGDVSMLRMPDGGQQSLF